jgi:hypothetical protein
VRDHRVRRRSGVVRRADVAVVAALLIALFGCGKKEEGEVLARVDGSALTTEGFYGSMPEHLLAVMSLEDQEEALKTWVKTELVYREGLRHWIGTDDAVGRRLDEIERELIAEECIRRRMAEVPEVTEEEAVAYFDEHESDYAIQVRLAHILVRNRQEALRALERIRSGTPFETVASAVSIDQTASMGGDLGYMRRGEMIHELEEVTFDLKVGEVSDVIASSYGYHVIKVLDRHPGPGQPSFESKRAAVLNFLTSTRRRHVFDEWLRDLEEHAVVLVDTALLRTEAERRMRSAADGGFIDGGEAASGESTAVQMQ